LLCGRRTLLWRVALLRRVLALLLWRVALLRRVLARRGRAVLARRGRSVLRRAAGLRRVTRLSVALR
jgi:hypothetical protein